MRLLQSLAMAGALLLGGSAFGQYRNGQPPYDRRAYEPLDQVRADLERAARDMRYLSHQEIKRIDKVRGEIGDFQRKWERGRFDRGELHGVIKAIERVVDHNRLQPRDREMLRGDIARLHEFSGRYR